MGRLAYLVATVLLLVALMAVTSASAHSGGTDGLPHLSCSAFYSAVTTCSDESLNLQQNMAAWCDDCVLHVPTRHHLATGLKSHPWAAASGLLSDDDDDNSEQQQLSSAPDYWRNDAQGGDDDDLLPHHRHARSQQQVEERFDDADFDDVECYGNQTGHNDNRRRSVEERFTAEEAEAALQEEEEAEVALHEEEERFDDAEFDDAECYGNGTGRNDNRRRSVEERFTAEEAEAALQEEEERFDDGNRRRLAEEAEEATKEARCALWFTNRSRQTGCFQRVIAYHTQGSRVGYNFTNVNAISDDEPCVRPIAAVLAVVDPLQRGASATVSPYGEDRSVALDKCQSNMEWSHCCFQIKSLPMFGSWETMAGLAAASASVSAS